MLTRRQFTLTAAATVAAAAVPAAAHAAVKMTMDKMAAGPITVIVPFSKTGPTDQIARFIAEPLAKVLGQSVQVQNITGDWGMTGAAIAANAKADGHTLVLGQLATHAALPVLMGRYDALNDFTPIGLVGVSPMVVLVRRDLPFNNLGSLQAYLHASPNRLTISQGGMGSASSMAAHKLKIAMGRPDLQEKVYAGTAAALDDLIKGDADILIDQMITALPAIRAGKVKAVGIASISRNHLMPDVLTGTQQGFRDLYASNWNALFAPKGTPQAVQSLLADALNTLLEDVTVQRKMREQGLHVPFVEQRGPEQLVKLQLREMDDVAKLLRPETVLAA